MPSLDKTLLAFAPLHFVLHSQFACCSSYLLTSCFCLSVPYDEKDINKQDGRLKGHVLIFSCVNSEVATSCFTTMDRMLDSTKKIKNKKKSQFQRQRRSPNKMVGGAKLFLESNLILTRDAWRTQTNSCAHQDPDVPQRLRETYL